MEITSEEQNKVKRKKRTEDSLRDLWDNIKDTNIQTIVAPKEEKQGRNGETNIKNRVVDMERGEERVKRMERVTWKRTLTYVE